MPVTTPETTLYHVPTEINARQRYNPYPTHTSNETLFMQSQAEKLIADFYAPIPLQTTFSMGFIPDLETPEEPVGGVCMLTYLGREYPYNAHANHFRLSNPNFYGGKDFFITVYTSTTKPSSPSFSIIRQYATETYGWHGRIVLVKKKLQVIWSKHIVDYLIEHIPRPTPPPSPLLPSDQRQEAKRTYRLEGLEEWLEVHYEVRFHAASNSRRLEFPIRHTSTQALIEFCEGFSVSSESDDDDDCSTGGG